MVINFTDAKALFIVDGEMVRLETTTGAIDISVEVNKEIKQGVLMVHQVWEYRSNNGQKSAREKPVANVNFLHSDVDLGAFTGMLVVNGTACKVEKLSTN